MSRLLKQQFKTLEGASKRARFETAHCDGKYRFVVVRCVRGEPDTLPFNEDRFADYTWRLEKIRKPETRDV